MTRTLTSRRLLTGLGAVAAAVALAACSGRIGTVTETSPPASSTSSSPAPSASSAASADPALATFYAQKLRWSGCGGGFDCTKLTVPLDYADPTGETISIQVLRLKASDQAHKLGSLVLNPGGPGGSGVDYARAARAVVDAPVRAKYDIVGFDPRGVGLSDPIACLDDKQLDAFISADGTPDTPAEVSQSEQLSQEFADACKARSPKLYAHISTEEAVRDIDILRAALGDTKLNWLGYSYGTLLGATYADLFPTTVGRMVLDGALDPALSNVELIHGQAKGFELALHRFVQDCAQAVRLPAAPRRAGRRRPRRDSSSPTSTRSRSRATTRSARSPRPSRRTRSRPTSTSRPTATGTPCASACSRRSTATARCCSSMLDERLSRNEAGHYTDNSTAALYAVSALDRPDRPDATESAALAAQWAKEAPVFGAFTAWGILPYHYWGVPATGKPHEIHAPGSPPILVVGTTYDPATPYPWAQALAKQLSKGVLLTRVGDGHTGYGKGSTCTDQAVDRFLTTGTAPPAGTVCR